MSYRDFENHLLIGLYRAWKDGRDIVSFGRVIQDHGLEHERGWIVRAHESLTNRGFIEGPANRRVEEMTAGRLTSDGMLFVEDNLLEDASEDISNPDGLAPGSDRVVRFDHNSEQFLSITVGIADLSEAVRGDNSLEIEPDERSRIVSSLNSALILWDAAQLKVIQVKIGVLMAVEDAGRVLASTAKAVAAALLVDTIKSFVKVHTGMDLDHI